MKKLSLVAGLFLTLIFASCEERNIDELLTITAETKFNETFDVNVPKTTDAVNEVVSFTLDGTTTNAEVRKLKKLTIKKLTFKIVDYVGEKNATISVKFRTSQTLVYAINGVNLNNAHLNNTVFEVTDKAVLNTMSQKFLTDRKIDLKAIGTVIAQEDLTFKIKVFATVDLTANLTN